MSAWKWVANWTTFPRWQEDTVKSGRRFKWGTPLWTVEDLWLCRSRMGYFFFHVFACCIIFIIERWGKGEEQRQTTELQSGISISWAAIVTFLWLGDGYRTLQYSILALSLEGVFFILFPLPCSRGAIEELQVATQRSEHLYLQVGDGFGWRCQGGRGHGAIEQRVGWVAARRVCSLPVGLQVFSQVFTSILQLILI